MKRILTAILMAFGLALHAAGAETKKGEKAKATRPAEATDAKKSGKAEVVDADEDKDESSTKFDFDAATLEGKMKAPPGMMLKGRVEQNKNQMVQLRKNFRAELKKSSSSNRAIKPKD